MFGLTRAEKLRKNLDKNGINTVGECIFHLSSALFPGIQST